MNMADVKDVIKEKADNGTLVLIVLNVGDGDSIIVKFPTKHGKRACAVVDCYNAKKTIAALKILEPETIPFICATHPHFDHTKGLLDLIRWCVQNGIKIEQFWDCGFRHVSKTHYDLIQLLREHPDIGFIHPTSGFEWVINKVRVLVISPSIHLKNRYDTFGTNINNASVVIKLEYPPRDIAFDFLSPEKAREKDLAVEERRDQHTVILGGDAQFDAWARITDEFPELQRTQNRRQMIDPEVIKHRPLRCQVLKVPHHMSKHGVSLEVLEILRPRYTIASCSNSSTHGFPHELTVMAVEDVRRRNIDKGMRFTGHRDKELRSGTVVALFREKVRGKKRLPLVYGLGESISDKAPLPKLD
jgi:beta-lactamase superfamily II metal-dependent hydrolase